jgi:hypothetical protein
MPPGLILRQAAQVDHPEVLRGHANERETHNSVR